MAKTFAAQISDFAKRSEEKTRAIMRASVQDVLQAAQTDQVALARGATAVIQGQIPRDTGSLMNSLASGLNGAFGPESELSYVVTIQQMEIGDVARFAWTAPYAVAIEYGFDTYPGAHFVGANAARWQQFVSENAKRLK